MKKLITAMLALAAIAPLSAQQLPNNGFEEDWVDMVPWTSTGNTVVSGQTPTGWKTSNTIGTKVFGLYLGKFSLSDKVAGYNSDGAVKVHNQKYTSQFIPGYFTLGTPWSTSVMTSQKDGGTFDGIKFSYTPDAISFYYKAEITDGSVVAYSWSGTYEQADVPGNIVASGNPTTKNMQNRDRHILKEVYTELYTASNLGGAFTANGTLVAYGKKRTLMASEWKPCTLDLTYHSQTTAPEKINVIFSTGDYFTEPQAADENNTMTVDDVKLLYYSRLKTITVNGIEANLEDAVFDEDGHCTYDLSESINMPRSVKAIKWECLGESPAKTVSVALDAEKNTATITVNNTNKGATDVDGKAEHVYTIKFRAPRVVEGGIEYPGHITTLTMDGGSLIGDDEEKILVEASIWMTQKGMKRIVDVLLPDLTLPGLGYLGDILVENVTRTYNNKNGSPIYVYTGHVDDLQLEFAGMPIHAEVVLEGTSDVAGNVSFKIHVKWDPNATQSMVAREATGPNYIPIEVEFNGKTATPEVPTGINDVTVDGADAPVEYFDLQGIRVSNPQAGQMVIRRQGTNVEKILVK